MILPGWNCADCLTFNGEEKTPLHECRACGKPRKTFGLPLETMMRHLRALEENLCATQQRCTRQEEELRANHQEIADAHAMHQAAVGLSEKEKAEHQITAGRIEAFRTLKQMFSDALARHDSETATLRAEIVRLREATREYMTAVYRSEQYVLGEPGYGVIRGALASATHKLSAVLTPEPTQELPPGRSSC